MNAQTVTIPDANFAAYLQATIPAAMNGNLMDTSSKAVKTLTDIYAPVMGIADLQGIQYFSALKYVMCSGNPLSSLPPLPDSLENIACSSCKLSSLPSLPHMLQELWCDGNQLTGLPVLPNTVTRIYCNQNLLSNLPVLPNGLIELHCDDNSITTLPGLPSSLKILSCSDNQLTSVPILPDSLQFLDCHKNKISCFPVFPTTLKNIFIFSNAFSCLPNYVAAMNGPTLMGSPLVSYSLCNLDNPSGCPVSTDVPTSVIIPNIFTPNGDNINDAFVMKGANLSNFTGKIYDRWGKLIYQWTDINTGWNGKDYSNGTYYYVVSYTNNTGKTITKNGFFQLLR